MSDVGRYGMKLLFVAAVFGPVRATVADIGVGAVPPPGAEVLIDGTRERLDDKWTYWRGPRFASSLPIKWQIVADPVDSGTVLMSDDPAAAGGKYGTADIVTKKKYRDFRLHIEFLVMKPGGNSGVYLQNRYEIQILDGDKTKHGMGAVINEAESPYPAYNGVGKWNAYDITFRGSGSRTVSGSKKRCLRCISTDRKCTKTKRLTRSGVVRIPALMAATTAEKELPMSRAASNCRPKATMYATETRGSKNSIWPMRIRISRSNKRLRQHIRLSPNALTS